MSSEQADKPQLTGYELLDHLGSGGYGEVWSARVPGGLIKAVKVIHGRHDESRAANELKSLERIREVRHPFVVSLERVEFVDNRLVVVSELAEGSLRDRHRDCVQMGLCGIPREELLRYLRDAADALDYLSSKHGLQHLDIKPENILLLAGHAKVADFGLVKAIDDRTQSIVGGMTPAYAPPEVFKGAPGRTSDQYSLAVLYQQLLTGTLPFNGENAAELTMQHLHDEPSLDVLSADDRYVVSRALSKTPAHRYSTCTEFVQALSAPQRTFTPQSEGPVQLGRSAPAAQAGDSDQASRHRDVQATVPCADQGGPISTDLRMQLPDAELPPITELDEPEWDSHDQAAVPTFYLGIGGAAACVLRELRQQQSERYELSGPIPAGPMLLMDTDPRTISAVSRNADGGAGLKREETVCLNLRRPQEYREKSDKILGWLGRRWLYNIPKSLQTEGIRPLGRLALVDNSRRTLQRIRGALAECVSAENIDASEELTGRKFRRDAVRVFIVSSIAGATGGGMALDVAYAVRGFLEKLGLADTQLVGINLFSTGREAERAGLARVNAYSWLTEHQHFCHPANAYLGDDAAGFPPHEQGVRPFDHSYLAHLGERLDDGAFLQGCKSVADYLFATSSTPAAPCLEACRQASGEDRSPLELRTFAVKRHEAAPADARRDAEQLLINLLLSAWLGESKPDRSAKDASGTNRVVMGAGELVGRLKLDAAHIATQSRAIVEEQAASLAVDTGESTSMLERLEAINAFFVPSPDLNTPLLGESATNQIGEVSIVDLVRPFAEELQASIAEWVLSQLDKPGDRLNGGRQAADWLHDHCESLTSQFQRYGSATQQKLQQVAQQASAPDADPRSVEDRYTHLKTDLAALEGAALITAGLKTELREIMGRLSELRVAAGSVAKDLSTEDRGDPRETHRILADANTSPARLAVELDGQLQQEWQGGSVSFAQLLESDEGRREIVSAVKRHSQQCVREALMTRGGGEAVEFNADVSVSPLAECCTGFRRILLSPPGASEPTESRDAAIVIENTTNDSYAVSEYEGLSATHAAVALVGGRRDYAEFAKRVATRRDVAWNDLLAQTQIRSESTDSCGTLQVNIECGSVSGTAPASPMPEAVQ
ncbi:Tubulin-like protein [Posidoniimonas polymericola]|uniref:Tubulin-like protein n=1 Tax=Posidoniimonas polymericola TaxID=2528002 RepID=A0A5C5YMJ6_9BACT|nr:tubulin-like doman-containing protein [Posidoniimonas polymericola]TWT76027.1 Tubulin-like protein [Posidoniimonas polymericola]